MRRRLLLLALILAECGGSSRRNRDASGAVLQTADAANLDASGVGAMGEPQVADSLGTGGGLRLLTLAGERQLAGTLGLSSADVLTNDFVLSIQGNGTTVVDLRSGASRTIDGVLPLATDGDRVIWKADDGLSVEDLNTAVRTPVPILIEGDDAVLDLRNGRLLVDKTTLVPIEGGQRVDSEYRVDTLDGTTVSTLKMPTGGYAPRPVALDSSGEVAGTATRPGAILSVDSRFYPVRWDASGAPTFLDTATPATAVGIQDDGSVVVGPDENEAGRLRLLRGGTSIDLGVALPFFWQARVRGRFVFVQNLRSDQISVYPLP